MWRKNHLPLNYSYLLWADDHIEVIINRYLFLFSLDLKDLRQNLVDTVFMNIIKPLFEMIIVA